MFVFQREANHPCEQEPSRGIPAPEQTAHKQAEPKGSWEMERVVFEMKLTEDRVVDEGSRWTVSAKKKSRTRISDICSQSVTALPMERFQAALSCVHLQIMMVLLLTPAQHCS